jgi:uncharacterized protein with LGFP repeats
MRRCQCSTSGPFTLHRGEPGPRPGGRGCFWPSSVLRYPTTDETATPDGIGRFNNFSYTASSSRIDGSIYYTPGTGAWSIHGAIRAKYLALGGPSSVLRYPTTDETAATDGIGRFNNFSYTASSSRIDGSIYYTPGTGAWSIHGAIVTKWEAMGAERSCLGYPLSDEFSITGRRRNNLQHGIIKYSFSSRQAVSSC